MSTRLRSSILLFLVSVACTSERPSEQLSGERYTISSPEGSLKVVIENDSGQLHYRLTQNETVLIDRSRLSILPEVEYEILDSKTLRIDNVWEPVWGQFSQVRDHCTERTIDLKAGATRFALICRVYDDGVGLRFSFPEQAELSGRALQFEVEYRFDADYPMFHARGEGDPAGPFPISSFDADNRGRAVPALVRLGKDIPSAVIPAVVDFGNDRYLAILESDLHSAVLKASTTTMELARAHPQPGLLSVNSAEIRGDSYDTPWRVFLVGNQAAGMLVNPVPLNLAAECKIPDPSWVKSGKSLWDWRVRGYKGDGFTYGADTESYKRFIDFAGEHDFRYFLIDWLWYWVREGKFTVNPEIDVEAVIAHGRNRGVEVLLYWDEYRGGSLPMDEVFGLYHTLGASGVKYGFRGNDAEFTAEAIEKAAKHQLVINFHDLPCPMVGVERTYPNAVTREYCHAQMDAGRVSSPRDFLRMVMINGITGPLDMNNGMYALNTSPESTPRVDWHHNLESTVAAENAKVLIAYSGLILLPDAPEEYQKKSDLFEFLARMPQANWDETRILRSKMGEYLSMARRSGEEWFVGSVVNEEGGSLDIALDFLDANKSYDATFYEDAADTHYQKNKESYRVRGEKVQKETTVKAIMAPGGGHSIWIRPAG